MIAFNSTVGASLAGAGFAAAVLTTAAITSPVAFAASNNYQLATTVGLAALTGASGSRLGHYLTVKADIPQFFQAGVFASSTLGLGALTLFSMSTYFL